MAKVLTDKEILDIISKAINGKGIVCEDSYLSFLEDIGHLVANHFGGEFLSAEVSPENEDEYFLSFAYDEFVPEDGGVYARYDTEKPMEEWKAESAGKKAFRKGR